MARSLTRASSEYLQPAVTPNRTASMSWGAWIRPQSIGSGEFHTLLSKGTIGGDRNYYFDLRNPSGTPQLEFAYTVGGSFVEYRHTQTLTASQLYHIVWTVNWSSPAVELYIDGAAKSPTLAAGTPGTPDTTATQTMRIGALVQSTSTQSDYYNGEISELFIVTEVITAAEVASLAQGFSPPLVLRSRTFDAYYPIIGRYSPEIDQTSARTATVTGTTTVAHPRIITPRRKSRTV